MFHNRIAQLAISLFYTEHIYIEWVWKDIIVLAVKGGISFCVPLRENGGPSAEDCVKWMCNRLGLSQIITRGRQICLSGRRQSAIAAPGDLVECQEKGADRVELWQANELQPGCLVHIPHYPVHSNCLPFCNVSFDSDKDILNSREKFEPGPGFEPRTSISLAWRSTSWI